MPFKSESSNRPAPIVAFLCTLTDNSILFLPNLDSGMARREKYAPSLDSILLAVASPFKGGETEC